MAAQIMASVGDKGMNLLADVGLVQRLLALRGFSPGTIDRICGRRTIHAIEAFQAQFLGNPDGLVETHGPTWSRLSGQLGHSQPRRSPTPPARTAPRPVAPPTAPAPSVDGKLSQLIAVPAKATMNVGLSSASNAHMRATLGEPRAAYTQDCAPVTNEKLKRAMTTRNVGPFNVNGLSPAVDSLAEVMTEVRRDHADVYAQLTTAGMLCCRLQRGSSTAVSNHSWGTAIDLGLRGHGVDPRGDNRVYIGLAMIAPIFNRHGWYWGAAFRTEDAMHFEAGKALIDSWGPRL